MPGFVRPHSRHSALDHNLPRSAVRPFSVIPRLTITCPDPRSGPIPSFLRKQESMFIGTRRRKGCRKETKYLRPPSADQNGPRVKPGVTGEEGGMDPGSSPSFFPRHSCESRACPGLDPGNPCSNGPRVFARGDGGRGGHGHRVKPGVTAEEGGMDTGSSPGVTEEERGMDPGSSPGVTQEQAQRRGWTFYEAVFDEGPAGEPMPERRQPSSF
jgi:hypothetical protein